MNYEIRQLNEDDWRELSQIRLTALKNDPQVFGSNYEKESHLTESDWRGKLRSDDSAIFMIYDNETPIGMTGIAVDRADSTGKTAHLWGSWLAPEYRGKGISTIIYQARLEWAKNHPTIRRILVSHRASNAASKYANQKHGFKFTHAQEKTWIDGVAEDEFFYELHIKKD